MLNAKAVGFAQNQSSIVVKNYSHTSQANKFCIPIQNLKSENSLVMHIKLNH